MALVKQHKSVMSTVTYVWRQLSIYRLDSTTYNSSLLGSSEESLVK